MPKGVARTGTCATCAHGEVIRINYLVAAGAPVRAVAGQFGLSEDSIHRHFKNHVTDRFKRAVKVGSFASEADLAKACADAGTSVVEHLRAQHAICAAEIAIAQEAGARHALVGLLQESRKTLVEIGRITREYLPGGNVTNVNQTFYQLNVLAEIGNDLSVAFKSMPDAQRVLLDVLDRRLALPQQEALEHAA